MDRSDATAFGIALAGHAALLTVLSLGLAKASLPPVQTQPMEVEFVEDVGLVSAAPTPTTVEPAARLGEPDLPVEPLPPVLPQVQPLPQPSVTPAPPPPQPSLRPQPQPKARPAQPKAAPKPAPPQQPAVRPGGRLTGLLKGVGERESPSRSVSPPARTAGPAVQASLAAEIRRQLKPHWKAPTGADVELLRTQVSISLAANGNVTSIEIVGTTGQNASNRPQVRLHQEQAERAVRLASPLRLPSEFYEAWKQMTVTFDRRLSQ
jgi:outer membrane biosynthesis protein TonB